MSEEEGNEVRGTNRNDQEVGLTTSDTLSEDTGVLNTIEIPIAGFWIRAWAYLFDLLVVVSLNGIVIAPVYLLGDVAEFSIGTFTIVGIVSTLISFGYFTVMTKLLGQTLGKMVFGLKVYSYDHLEMTWLDVIFREVVGRYIHQSLLVTNVLYLIVAFSPEKRGLHDRVGRTFVGLESRKTKSIIQKKSEKNNELKPDMA
ncbi:RDD family protein [Salipaludibacillus sp. CF4.18]|uniref:RDD family protein n=1 Tax=Salipaludibacillus sp. CF4.18 TaxID=3373081 RepID=UPI003EE4D75A